MGTQILSISAGSDGDGRKWPKHHYERNDEYFLERLAAEWIKDSPGGPQAGVIYKLDRMPAGYAGFQRFRPDSKHVDRYIYGHPNGQFRSLVEFYPHFKHLMDFGGSAGCTCVKCAGTAKKTKDLPERRSKYFPPAQNGDTQEPTPFLISPMRATGTFKKGRWSSEELELPRRKEVDLENTPDIYELFVKRLKEAGPKDGLDELIDEKLSPDRRTTNSELENAFNAVSELPRYAPRIGELVLFVRKLGERERLAWDKGTNAFRCLDLDSQIWQATPKWEAGVITQTPQESVAELDLITDEQKEQSILYSGFKIEPLSEPGNESKSYTKQHKHVPLHAIRPLTLWRDCLQSTLENDWHPTVKYALTVSSSVCCVGRYRFRGTWPNASVFCHGLYLGPELIAVGDAVRLLPREGDQRSSPVTEVMIITSIRLRFVNLDFDEDDLAPTAPALPYQTGVHISGRVYTAEPSRSFKGVSKTPLDPKAGILPSGLDDYGAWYHYTDPAKASVRVEVPFSRILGRCYEHSAMCIWFTAPSKVKTEMQPPAFKAVNAAKPDAEGSSADVPLLSRGLVATRDGRKYSLEHDTRLTSTDQAWFWADTRIEQLDLHEVNGRFVGAKDATRAKEFNSWQKAVKGLSGKKGGLEEFEAAHKRKVEKEKAILQSTGGMMGSAAVDTEMESVENGDSAEGTPSVEQEQEEEQDEEPGDFVDVDESVDAPKQAQVAADRPGPPQKERVMIDLSGLDSEDEDEMAQNELVGEFYKNVRSG